MKTSGFRKGQMIGLEASFEKAKEEGKAECALQIAKRMLATGAKADFVAHITDLPLITVHTLHTKIKASAD